LKKLCEFSTVWADRADLGSTKTAKQKLKYATFEGGFFSRLAAILQHYSRRLIFMKHFIFIINFQREKALIILIVKSLQIELHSTNLLL
jgi:hypothetical protein